MWQEIPRQDYVRSISRSMSQPALGAVGGTMSLIFPGVPGLVNDSFITWTVEEVAWDTLLEVSTMQRISWLSSFISWRVLRAQLMWFRVAASLNEIPFPSCIPEFFADVGITPIMDIPTTYSLLTKSGECSTNSACSSIIKPYPACMR